MNINTDDFDTWLNSKNALDIVGISRDGESCPLANYLKLSNPEIKFVTVTPCHVSVGYYNGDLQILNLPEIFYYFVKEIDELRSQRPIMALEAREILSYVREMY